MFINKSYALNPKCMEYLKVSFGQEVTEEIADDQSRIEVDGRFHGLNAAA